MTFSTWNYALGDISNKSVNSVFINGNNAIAGTFFTLSGDIYVRPRNIFNDYGNYSIHGNGVYYSTNSGKNWFKSSSQDDALSSLFVNSLYMVNSNAILCAAQTYNVASKQLDGAGLYYSTNYGKHWIPASFVDNIDLSTLTVYSVYMNGSNALIGTNNGGYHSIDCGKSWQKIDIYINDLQNVCSLYADGNNSPNAAINYFDGTQELFVVESNVFRNDNGSFYYSSNCGLSWNDVSQQIKSVENIETSRTGAPLYSGRPSNKLYISGSNALMNVSLPNGGGLIYSSDGGQSWNRCNGVGYQKVDSIYMNGTYAFAFLGNDEDAIKTFEIAGIDLGFETITGSYGNQYVRRKSLPPGLYFSTDSGKNFSFLDKSTSYGFYGLSHFTFNNFINDQHLSLSGNNLIAGTDISGVLYSTLNITCFKEDAKILTDKGYIKIQELRPGDLVKTLSNGFKPIHSIGKRDIHHPASSERIKDQLYLCTKENYPELLEDLVITGGHSILVSQFKDDIQQEKNTSIFKGIVKTEGYYNLLACVDERASVYSEAGNYTIYHFALENNDCYTNYGVYANGLSVETMSKKCLNEFSGMELI